MVPTPAVRYPSFQFGGLRQKFERMPEDEFDALARRRPTKVAFCRKMSKGGFSDAELADAFDSLRGTAARMQRMFDESGGPWLLGAQYSLADIAVAPLLDRLEDLGFEGLWDDDYPRMSEWLARMQARPAYVRAFYPGSRVSEQYSELRLGRGSHRHVLARNAATPA